MIQFIDGISVADITPNRLAKVIKWLERTKKQYMENLKEHKSLEGAPERIQETIIKYKEYETTLRKTKKTGR